MSTRAAPPDTPLAALLTGAFGLLAAGVLLERAAASASTSTLPQGAAAFAAGLTTLAISIAWLTPGLRGRLLDWSLGPFRRAVFVTGALLWLAWQAVFVLAVYRNGGMAYFGGVPAIAVAIAFAVTAVLYIVNFVAPGRAFRRAAPERPDGLRIYSAPRQIDYSTERLLWRRRLPLWRRALAAATGLWVILLVAGYVAFQMPVLPSDRAAGLAADPTFLGVAVLAGVLLGLVTPLDPTSPFSDRPGAQRMLVIAVIAGASALAPLFLTRTAPLALSVLPFSETRTVTVDVTERGHGIRRGSCDFTARVRLPGGAIVRLCEIPRDIWQALTPGDRLAVSGTGGALGLRIAEISRP